MSYLKNGVWHSGEPGDDDKREIARLKAILDAHGISYEEPKDNRKPFRGFPR